MSEDEQTTLKSNKMDTLTKDPNEGLLKALQCPRCSRYMVPPISFCENGHNICNNCKPKLSRCPECKQPYLRGTNITLENVARQVEYPCNYRNKGCQESFPVHLILDHQDDCRYGPYNCPILLAGRRRCSWNGPLADMKNHLQDEHKDDVWNGCGVYKKQQIMVSPSGLHNNVIITFGEIFYIQFRGQDGNYYGLVKYIGPKSIARKYKCEILICSEDGNEKLMACYLTRNFKEENEEIIRVGKCLKLHYDVVKKFLNDQNNLNINIEISQIL